MPMAESTLVRFARFRGQTVWGLIYHSQGKLPPRGAKGRSMLFGRANHALITIVQLLEPRRPRRGFEPRDEGVASPVSRN